MQTSMRITGVESTIKAMRAAGKKDAINIAEGIDKALRIIGNKAQEYVPKETGLLAASMVTVNTGVGFGAVGTISFGGPDAPYAWAVHEVPATHTAPTRVGYLRAAVLHTRGTVTAMMRRQMLVGTRGTS